MKGYTFILKNTFTKVIFFRSFRVLKNTRRKVMRASKRLNSKPRVKVRSSFAISVCNIFLQLFINLSHSSFTASQPFWRRSFAVYWVRLLAIHYIYHIISLYLYIIYIYKCSIINSNKAVLYFQFFLCIPMHSYLFYLTPRVGHGPLFGF